jgi:hypothetical protein
MSDKDSPSPQREMMVASQVGHTSPIRRAQIISLLSAGSLQQRHQTLTWLFPTKKNMFFFTMKSLSYYYTECKKKIINIYLKAKHLFCQGTGADNFILKYPIKKIKFKQ